MNACIVFTVTQTNKIHILIGDDDLLVRKHQLKPLFFKYAFCC